MRSAIVLVAMLSMCASQVRPCRANDLSRDDPLTAARTKWWRDAKFGMFIHWGLYSVAAGSWEGKPEPPGKFVEWLMSDLNIPVGQYEKLAVRFNPVRFDARRWARVARDAGMKYVVITAKHHDGFSMFATKVNHYNILDATAFGRDPLRELAAACRESRIRFGVYYSIMDWHDPDANAEGKRHYTARAREQIRELIVQYDPDILWFDGEWVPWWTQRDGRELEAFVRALKPAILINNRVGKRTPEDGDFGTPEQEVPEIAPSRQLWETCMTLNDSWGFRADDHHWKSADNVIAILTQVNAKGGNLLLNVGPDAQAEIPEESVRILTDVGHRTAR